MEVARPLASAVEHARLHAESARRAEELAALNRTSQLITARLDLPSVLETISRSVTSLMGSTGCGIGLLSADDRTLIEHAAAHGFRTPEWRTLSVRVGEGLIGLAVSSGQAVRVRRPPRGSALRAAGPGREGGHPLHAERAAAGRRPDHRRHLRLLAPSRAPSATASRRCWRASRIRRASRSRTRGSSRRPSGAPGRPRPCCARATRSTRASTWARRSALILNQAREVLEVQSCGLFTLDAATGELTSTASLDLPAEDLHAIRLRVGEGITGVAVKERRPLQTADLYRDPRVRYPQAGLRSMLAAPLIVGEQTIGALTVLRTDVHHFSAEEESLVSAFADQAAMALEHARLFSSVRTYSERLEAMVEARTHELDEQKRFVEVVLETLPLGLFVLDAELRVISTNREGAALVPVEAAARRPFAELMPPAKVAAVRAFLEGAVTAREVRHAEEELPAGGETLTRAADRDAAPRPAGHPRAGPGGGHHAAEAARAPDGADRAAHHRGAAGRGGGARAEQPARHHRGLRGGPEGAGARSAPARPGRVQGLPELSRADRGGGLPLQGDHREPAPLRARPGQPARPDRSERAGGQGAGADRPPVPLRPEPVRAALRRRAARRGGQRGPAPPGLPRARQQRARRDGGPRAP